MSDVRRFDTIERVVRDIRRHVDDLQSTVMARLATHTHEGGGSGGAVDSVNGETGTVVLDAADVGADASGTATAAVTAHEAETDPHTQYHDNTRGDARYYTQSAADTLLAGKANASHTHDVDDINATGTPSSTTYLRGDGTWSTPSGGGSTDGDEAEFVQTGTGQSLTSSSSTLCRFDTNTYLTSGIVKTSAGDGHYFTLNRAGLWLITAAARIGGSSSGDFACWLGPGADANSDRRAFSSVDVDASAFMANSVALTMRFDAGDTVGLWLYQSTTGSRSLEIGSNPPSIQLTWLRPAAS